LIDLAPFSWLTLLGTSENIPDTFFQKVTEGEERGADWKIFKWTAYDNPFMREKWAIELNEILTTTPNAKDLSWFKTHYLNEWCTDDDLQIIPSKRIIYEKFRSDDYNNINYVLGVDLGYNDASSFVLMAYGNNKPNLHIVKAFKASSMDLTDVAETIKTLRSRYPIGKYIVDGANKQGVEEIKNRHNIALVPAEKRDKATYLRLLKDDVISGMVLIDPDECEDLTIEWDKLIWKNDKKDTEDPRCQNHCSDAALYGWRECSNYMWRQKEKRPHVHSEAAMLASIKKEADIMRQMKEEQEQDDWDDETLGEDIW
jgi:hypothetical protein